MVGLAGRRLAVQMTKETVTLDAPDEEWPEFLTVAEVAVITRLSKMTVYRMAASGELDNVRIGRSVRVKADSLRAYLKG